MIREYFIWYEDGRCFREFGTFHEVLNNNPLAIKIEEV